MKVININRVDANTVKFDEVSIDTTENVCFRNLDPLEAHWPTLASNQLGQAPSANSNQCALPPGQSKIIYGCKIAGHQNEQGIIYVYPALAIGAGAPSGKLANATKGTPIAEAQVVQGGKPPYTVNRQIFQVTDGSGNVIQSGSGVGPGLKLNNPTTTQGQTGITVTGAPTYSGTYTFALDVNDSMGRNLQQQYTMAVT